MARLVKVAVGELSDRELADVAEATEPTDPQRAAALRELLRWREKRIGPVPIDEADRRYLVLRSGRQA